MINGLATIRLAVPVDNIIITLDAYLHPIIIRERGHVVDPLVDNLVANHNSGASPDPRIGPCGMVVLTNGAHITWGMTVIYGTAWGGTIPPPIALVRNTQFGLLLNGAASRGDLVFPPDEPWAEYELDPETDTYHEVRRNTP